MKIGFDAKRYFHNRTGLGNYSRDLVRILSQFYPENKYVLFNPKPTENFKVFNSKTIQEINPSSFLSKKLKGLWRSFGIGAEINKNSIDVFHGLSGEIPFGLPNSVKKIVTIHDLIFMRYPNLYSLWDRKIHFLKFKYATKKSDVIIAISEQTKADIIQFLDGNPEKIKVIYQGCAPIFKENFTAEEKESIKQKFNLPEKFLLNVGTLETRKNALNIVKATKNNQFPLVLVGQKKAYYKEIENFMLQNKMNNVLHVSCDQRELAIIYQLATIFVYPSVFEGFGIPIIEALYSKTAVITNKFGVFPEAGGPDSIYIDPNDTTQIELAINELWNDDQKRKEQAEKGFTFVQKFNDDVLAQQLISCYNNC